MATTSARYAMIDDQPVAAPEGALAWHIADARWIDHADELASLADDAVSRVRVARTQAIRDAIGYTPVSAAERLRQQVAAEDAEHLAQVAAAAERLAADPSDMVARAWAAPESIAFRWLIHRATGQRVRATEVRLRSPLGAHVRIGGRQVAVEDLGEYELAD